MDLIYFYGFLTFLSTVSGRVVETLPKSSGKQLFLSRNVVTESAEFDGGVLVNEEGIIEAVLKRDVVDTLLSNSLHNLQIIDGGDLALMAGVVDTHVHVNEPGRTSWEGYVTATRAAAVGGITTIIDMPLNSIPPTTTLKNLKTKAAMAREEIFVDVGFWGGVIPGNEEHLMDLIKAGVVGFKCFLTDSGVPEFPNVSPNDLTQVFEVLNGTGTVLAFHAEVSLNSTNKKCTTDCPSPHLFDTYLATHPEEMELRAAKLITSYLPQTDVHVHVVHVSAEGVVPILEEARERRIKSGYTGWNGGVTAETCNHYLTLFSEMVPPGHTEFKCSPPVRSNANRQKLWQYIKEERLDLITSDHSPSVANLKGTDFLTAWGGISSVQFDLSLFWTEAKARGYSLRTASHYLSAGPARLAGLQERKGAIRPGLDADLIYFDPNASFIVTPEVIRYKNKISPYMNRVLTGIVIRTYLRGQLIYADGELIGNPKGHLLLNDEIIQSPKRVKAASEIIETKNETKVYADHDQVDNKDRTLRQGKNLIPTGTTTQESLEGSIMILNDKLSNYLANRTENVAKIKTVFLENRKSAQENSTSIEHFSEPPKHSVTLNETRTHYDSNLNGTFSDKNYANTNLTTTKINIEQANSLGTVTKLFQNLVNRSRNFSSSISLLVLVTLFTVLVKQVYLL